MSAPAKSITELAFSLSRSAILGSLRYGVPGTFPMSNLSPILLALENSNVCLFFLLVIVFFLLLLLIYVYNLAYF